jgi:hypothetical protein
LISDRTDSTDSVSQEVTREVALKAIPKKKVKGNEESVWSEMRVLQGLDHPNIVRPPLFPFSHRGNLTCTCVRRLLAFSEVDREQFINAIVPVT